MSKQTAETERLNEALHRAAATVIAGALVLVAGCTASGNHRGDLVEDGTHRARVALQWKSSPGDPYSGRIMGTLLNGDYYTGRYLQITELTDPEDMDLMWLGFEPYWPDWRVDWDVGVDMQGMGPYDRFITEYVGTVIARLQDYQGTLMRCRLRLDAPHEGLAGGGTGECRLETGEVIRGVMLASP